ncbi:MAG: diguanylate cyclase [Lachnospiraceae bacterium]|nr:diguanylate cyclase [Lachnospiraceae bacterium]
MGSFDYISIIAVFGYLLLFLIFITANKNKIINSFLLVLVASICWTGGSFLMRIQAWPSYRVWYNVSICGLLLLAYALYSFVCAFAGRKTTFLSMLWLVLIVAACVINSLTGCFLAAPNMISLVDRSVVFEYNMTWSVGVLFAITGGVLFHMLYILVVNCRKNPVFRKQIEPTMLGMVLMFGGNLALLLPFLKGFPIDILSGLINALLMFYALIRRRLFRLKFLASEGVCYAAALMATLLVFYNLSPHLILTLQKHLPWLREDYVLVFAGMVVVVAMGFVFIWKRILSAIFVKEEQMQKECLQEFSLSASKSLRLKDIYEATVAIIKKATDVEDVYICMQRKPGYPYEMVYADSDLKATNFIMREDHPMVTYFTGHSEDFLFVRDFSYSVDGKALWHEERQMLNMLKIEYAIALKDGEELVGIVLFSNKDGKATISQGDTAFLGALGSIASIAIKNSMLYEKAFKEAVTDELTGLLNRRYFTERFQAIFSECEQSSLVLILIDIDDFKLYNQLYGMAEGDHALQQVARILQASVGENGIVARYYGKEFAVLLPHYDIMGAKLLAESISHQIHQMNSNKKNYAMRRLTASIGISAFPFGAHTMKEMLDNVDMAIYYVKHHGKNGIHISDSMTSVENPTGRQQEEFHPRDIYTEYESTIYALTAAIDTKDHYTFRHSNNVAYYATALAEALGMNEDTIETIRQAALLHDVGKIGIPEQILNKPSRLTEEEYEVIKGHVEASIGIIRHLPSLDYVIPAVIGHHERYDGKGYPRQIAGENIPATARILCIADSFDAIVSRRCYKSPVPLERARNILLEEAGRQFDPEMVTVFVGLLDTGEVKIAADEESILEEKQKAGGQV